LGLPTCAEWVPDEQALLKMMTKNVPPVIGAWCLLGIIAASMSTVDGLILAVGTVVSNNMFRQIEVFRPNLINSDTIILVARMSTLPFTLISTSIAAYYRSLDGEKAVGSTGYLLIVAFDIVLATTVVPLFGAFYAKNPSPRAALVSMLGGALTRLIMEFTLKKDGSMLLPFSQVEFLDYGPAASSLPPAFMNSTEVWNPSEKQCIQERYEDFTGVDSLSALLVSFLLFVSVQFIEHWTGKPLFEFSGSVGYEKNPSTEKEMVSASTKTAEVLFAVVVSYSLLALINFLGIEPLII
jgi:Na+/proline symporter